MYLSRKRRLLGVISRGLFQSTEARGLVGVQRLGGNDKSWGEVGPFRRCAVPKSPPMHSRIGQGPLNTCSPVREAQCQTTQVPVRRKSCPVPSSSLSVASPRGLHTPRRQGESRAQAPPAGPEVAKRDGLPWKVILNFEHFLDRTCKILMETVWGTGA